MPEPLADEAPPPRAEGPAEPAGPAKPPGPPDPWWQRFEFVWPLSIVAGFAGTWLGLKTGLPGAARALRHAGGQARRDV